MKPVVIAIACLTSGIAVGLSSYHLWLHRPKPEIDRVADAVREYLFDPESGRFYGMSFNPKTGAGCGVANSKNRYGGYVGPRWFVLQKNGKLTFEPVPDEDETNVDRKLAALIKQRDWVLMADSECIQGWRSREPVR